MTRAGPFRVSMVVAFALGCLPARAGDIVIEDQAPRAPIPPEVPGGAKPTLRDCQVTTTSGQGPDGEEIEHTRRTCRWAVPPP